MCVFTCQTNHKTIIEIHGLGDNMRVIECSFIIFRILFVCFIIERPLCTAAFQRLPKRVLDVKFHPSFLAGIYVCVVVFRREYVVTIRV